ncbi:MAG: serine/threonine protein kinase [Magnetococcales bacterium]|nr:serine/threonine protein kinase [Magnetococcales bacterium]MBF0156236.1 serine/threonine protein kinase [Magnetococcales bacterium]
MNRYPTLGNFRLGQRLGKGSAGVVYEGYDQERLQPVAIKTIDSDCLGSPRGLMLRERLRREARVLEGLYHPNIARVYAFREEEGIPFLVMELVRGETLANRLRSGNLPDLASRLGWVVGVLSGIAHVHGLGVVHRDLKPGNIVVPGDGSAVKVTDFGIASTPEESEFSVTRLSGTPGYMAPEQLMGGLADPRSDLFAIGVVLYELVIGQKPFPGESGSAINHRLLHADPSPFPHLVASLPPRLLPILERALAKRPGQRYASASAFREDLEEVLSGIDYNAG